VYREPAGGRAPNTRQARAAAAAAGAAIPINPVLMPLPDSAYQELDFETTVALQCNMQFSSQMRIHTGECIDNICACAVFKGDDVTP
jgi:hypothetical protein